MAFDGIITRAVSRELSSELTGGKIDKIYEPEPDSVVLNIHIGREQKRLFASCQSQGASVRLITGNPENPKEPYPFCMLLRKHLQGSRIISIEQRGTERIIEFTLERLIELMAINPRKRFGIPFGEEYTVWDLNAEKRIDNADFISLGKATPFEGWPIKGECLATVLDGRVVWKKG